MAPKSTLPSGPPEDRRDNSSSIHQRNSSHSTSPDSVGTFDDFNATKDAIRTIVRNLHFYKGANEPQGFDYSGNMCYRNAVLVMLMTSDVFMQYVIFHLRRLRIRSLGTRERPYSDPLTKLKRLSDTYWLNTELSRRAKAMSSFWKYVMLFKASERWPLEGDQNDEQDAQEFLQWLFSNVRYQLLRNNLIDEIQCFDDLLTVPHLERKICAACGSQNPVKHRMERVTPEDFLVVNLNGFGPDHKSTSQIRPVPTIQVLLQESIQRPITDWRCDSCFENNVEISHGIGGARAATAGKAGCHSAHLGRLPEVLFMYIQRSGWNNNMRSKDYSVVDITEHIDLGMLLDITVPKDERCNTRYRLRSVIAHCGDADGGHYCNYVRTDEEYSGSKWRMIDDEDVGKTVSFNDINERQPAWTPYILCWERIMEDDGLSSVNTILRSSSSGSVRSSQLDSQHLPESGTKNQTNPGSTSGQLFQSRPEATLSAQVSINGAKFHFKDILVPLFPHFHSFIRSKASPDIQTRVELIVENPWITLPPRGAFDLIKTQTSEPAPNGVKRLNWDHITEESKETITKWDGKGKPGEWPILVPRYQNNRTKLLQTLANDEAEAAAADTQIPARKKSKTVHATEENQTREEGASSQATTQTTGPIKPGRADVHEKEKAKLREARANNTTLPDSNASATMMPPPPTSQKGSGTKGPQPSSGTSKAKVPGPPATQNVGVLPNSNPGPPGRNTRSCLKGKQKDAVDTSTAKNSATAVANGKTTAPKSKKRKQDDEAEADGGTIVAAQSKAKKARTDAKATTKKQAAANTTSKTTAKTQTKPKRKTAKKPSE